MKLTIRFSDFDMAVLDCQHTGVMPAVTYRTVTIELTPEQIAALTPRRLGSEWRYVDGAGQREEVAIYERREVIALEDAEGV